MGKKETRFKLSSEDKLKPTLAPKRKKKRKIKNTSLEVAVFNPFHHGFLDTIFELPASQYDLSYPYQQVFLENSAYGL